MTHDYTRHGTVTLFAALVALTGKLITCTEACHTHVEWRRFVKACRYINPSPCCQGTPPTTKSFCLFFQKEALSSVLF
jgi:hypothetical protein